MNGKTVATIRKEVGLSQAEFSRNYGINLYTLRQWERKDTPLDSAVVSYLTCIKANPELVLKLLVDEA
ncbi:MAG TPA: hypothetical protein VFT64_07530 [Rickettsiales bacterium]|nr:hypothetical protein [Rickettsiales bacterium]